MDRDIPNERKFIVPIDVIEAWQTATIDGRPILINDAIEILPKGLRKADTWCTPLLLSILLVLLALWSLATLWVNKRIAKISGRVIDDVILGVVTLIGLCMTYLLFLSNLPCTDWNWLYIAFNPLPAVIWYWRKYWALPYAILMIIWVIGMIFAPHLLALWPHILIIIAFTIVLLKQWCVTSMKFNKSDNK